MNKKNEGVKIVEGVVMFSSKREKATIIKSLKALCKGGYLHDYPDRSGSANLPTIEIGPKVRDIGDTEGVTEWKTSTLVVVNRWKTKIRKLLPQVAMDESMIIGRWVIKYDFLEKPRKKQTGYEVEDVTRALGGMFPR